MADMTSAVCVSATLEPQAAEGAAETQDLVRRARDGDAQAREELARWCGQSAYRLALQLLRNPADAQDVSQDALISFFGSLDRFDDSRPVLPWLFRIVRNRVVDVSRRAKLRRGPSIDDEDANGCLEPVAATPDAQARAERHDLQNRIWRCLGSISRQHAEILVLRDYQDLSYREISEVLGIPQGTVMSRLHAARKSLRGVLVDDGFVFGE